MVVNGIWCYKGILIWNLLIWSAKNSIGDRWNHLWFYQLFY